MMLLRKSKYFYNSACRLVGCVIKEEEYDLDKICLLYTSMDKRTGMPADNNLASVTVIAENGAMADAYATALSVMGEEKAIAFQKKHPQIQIILIRKDGTFYQSEKAGMIKS